MKQRTMWGARPCTVVLFHLKCPEDLLGDKVQLIWLSSWTTLLFQEEVLQEC